MSALSNSSEKSLLDWSFGSATWSGKPTVLYFGLLTSAPSDTGGGTEVSAGGYARSSLAVGITNFNRLLVQGGSMTNKVPVAFPRATANWGTITHVAVYDASSGGNLVWWQPLSSSKTINEDDTFTWAAGELSWSLSGSFGGLLSLAALNYMFCNLSAPSWSSIYYIGLGTGSSGAALTGEANGGGYTRLGINNIGSFSTADALGSPQKTNAVDFNFAAASTDWNGGPFTNFAISLDARKSSAINGYWINGHGSFPNWIQTAAAHGLAVNDKVRFHGTASTGGLVPGNLTADTVDYYVKSVPTSTTIIVALTIGGAAVALDATVSASRGQVEKIVSPTTCTAATNDIWTSASHGLMDGDTVRLYNTTPANLPTVGGTALDIATDYFVINATVSTFQLAATAGGPVLDIDGAGTVPHYVIRQNDHIIWHGETGGSLVVLNTNQPGWTQGKLGLSVD